jgi:radical SAM superfamily enzyme YgiQ (UPF0313 family)
MKTYVRTWKMEPLPVAAIAALAPPEVEKRFHDDRLEPIPFDEPTDLVAISVETYTARRSYQIASEFRKRGVPVVMGGFHATLCPDEVRQYCESIVIGEAEDTFPELIDDYRHGRPKREYRATSRPAMSVLPDRSVYAGKKYLPIRLAEFARGCRFKCDFCAIQSFFQSTHSHRPVDQVVSEIHGIRRRGQMIFFVDDNITSSPAEAKELMRALIPLKVRWVSQASIDIAHDEEALELMKRSGCQGILVGLESLDHDSISQMNKGFNLKRGGPEAALAKFRRHGLRIYGTFVFGYDHDRPESITNTVRWAREQALFIAAFNHIRPFPGTPLYERMKSEGRLIRDPWWLDEQHRYNMVPFQPAHFTPDELAQGCVRARRDFYSWRNILRRASRPINSRHPWMLLNYLVINFMHQRDVITRTNLPLGDASWRGELLKAYPEPAPATPARHGALVH